MLDIADLIAKAGGNPWEINRTLRAGSPRQIDNLAKAFRDAGQCTAAACEEFDQAKQRFDAAWNHQDGDHPINDSAEVQRVTKGLGTQSLQLAKIGADLEDIAAALAEAQKRGAAEIEALNHQLQLLDKIVVAAQKDLEDSTLDEKSRHALLTLIDDAKADEADDVRDALVQMRLIRGIYTSTLHAAQANLVKDGYDPAGIWADDAHFGPGEPSLGTLPGTGPKIDGPATPPLIEGQNTKNQDDLDLSIPGTGIALGGDGAHGSPNILVPPDGEAPGVNGPNPVPHPEGTRPLPTGTAVGPNGEHYGFYGFVPLKTPDGQDNQNYSVPDTVVVDLAHPDKVLYTLHGISQASGVFDPNTGKMVIMGNNEAGQRGLWESAPVKQNGSWGNTLQSKGTFSGELNGNRESQITALPQGKGFMMVGAADGKPIQGAVASTPEGLLKASPTPLVGQLPDKQWSYGPTITDIREEGGKQVISMRVSTYGIGQYDPRTYMTTFSVTPGS
ncbi:hypothetical protein ACRU3B_10490 [Mycobacterium colombiense]